MTDTMRYRHVHITRKHASCDPGKAFLWAVMEYDLKNVTGPLGIDAACDFFKNRHMFRTRRYVGVDNNLEALRRGKRRHPDGEGLFVPLENLDLPQCCADAIVSSHTLQYLKPNDQLRVVDMFCRAVVPQGKLLIHVPRTSWLPEIEAALQQHFLHVDTARIGNLASRVFSRLFTKKGIFGNTVLFNSRLILRLSVLIASLEKLTCVRAGIQTRVYFHCTGAKHRCKPNPLRLESAFQIEPGIYTKNAAPEVFSDSVRH